MKIVLFPSAPHCSHHFLDPPGGRECRRPLCSQAINFDGRAAASHKHGKLLPNDRREELKKLRPASCKTFRNPSEIRNTMTSENTRATSENQVTKVVEAAGVEG